jgi:hypothetical protein
VKSHSNCNRSKGKEGKWEMCEKGRQRHITENAQGQKKKGNEDLSYNRRIKSLEAEKAVKCMNLEQ